jgi:nucleoside-diphosphate-sugar epimerase
MKILITGSSGVIGKELVKELTQQGHQIVGTTRADEGDANRIKIAPWRKLNLLDSNVDLVIHLAGLYSTKNDLDTKKSVFDSNVGISASVAEFCGAHRIPIIYLGSFFEKAPSYQQPWSYYAESKISASKLIEIESKIGSLIAIKVYLYDTYSEDLGRGKFIDLLLGNKNQIAIRVSPGNQKQDLTHIQDVVCGLITLANTIGDFTPGFHEYQMRSYSELTLQQLSEKVNQYKRNKLQLLWGELPYRDKEVFEIWNSAPDLPEWTPKHTLDSFLEDYFNRNSE